MSEERNNNVDTETMRVPEGYEKPHKGVQTGPVLGVLVLVLVLILAGLYLWGSMLPTAEPVGTPAIQNNEPETPRAEADVDILNTMSTSDDLGAIEADLSASNLDTLSTDLNTMQVEIDAVYE